MTTGASIAESSLKPRNFAGVDFTNSPLTDKLKESAHDAIDEIAVNVAKTENELRAQAASLGESLKKGEIPKLKEVLNSAELQTNSVEADLKSYFTKSRKFIQAHPIVSLGIAFTAGLLLPRMFKDKSVEKNAK